MSYHNPDYEERHPHRTGSDKKPAEQKLIEAIEKDAEKAQQRRDEEIKRDMEMLDRLNEFDLTEKDIRWVRHLIGLPDGRGIPLLMNWIQGRTGSCILHYDNKFVQKLPVGKFNERNL